MEQTILHVAVDAMNFSLVEVLDKKDYISKLINVPDNAKMTPMHIAATNFDIHIFDLLYNKNPDLSLKDDQGKTCIDYLRENDEVEVPEIYLKG